MQFLIRAMISSSVQWSNKEDKWVRLDKPIFTSPVGATYQMIISDLKTLSGVKQRVAKCSWPSDVVELRIYKMNGLTDNDQLLEVIAVG